MSEFAIELDTPIRRNAEIVAADMGDEVVMVSLKRNNYYGLDEIGGRVWALLEQPSTMRAVCEQLRREYDVDEETCARDVGALLAHMVREGLLAQVAV
jgi:hypothetical protein